MEFRSIRGVPYYVFDSEQEYIDYHISEGLSKHEVPKIKGWRDKDLKELDWIRADDGGICQALKIGHMQLSVNVRNKYVRTIVGAFIVNKHFQMDTDFKQHESRYTFSKTATGGKKGLVEREELTIREGNFVLYFCHYNSDPMEAYMAVFHTKNEKYAERRAFILLKQERIQVAIRKETEDMISHLGIGIEWQLTILKKIAADETSKKQMPRIAAVKEIAKISGSYDRVPDGPQVPRLPDGQQGKDGQKIEGIRDLNTAIVESDDSITQMEKAN